MILIDMEKTLTCHHEKATEIEQWTDVMDGCMHKRCKSPGDT